MMRKQQGVLWTLRLVGIVLVAVLAGCGAEEAVQSESSTDVGSGYTSDVLDSSYEGALDAQNQLILGTLQLEETGDAITLEQAGKLLPLWQALQGGVTAETEVNAVMKQIEGEMTSEQLTVIAGMQLTQEDMQAWMEEQGMTFRAPGETGEGQPSDAGEGRAFPQGGADGEVPPEMATMRAQLEDMTDEERAAFRATMQAEGGGAPAGAGRGAGGPGLAGGQGGFLLRPLIELLTERAAG